MIYACYNGWMGNGPVCVLVDAATAEDAVAQASRVLAETKDKPAGAPASYAAITEMKVLQLPLCCELDT